MSARSITSPIASCPVIVPLEARRVINYQSAGRPSERYGPRIRMSEFQRGTGGYYRRHVGYRLRNSSLPVRPGATVTVEAVSSVKDAVPSPLLPLACRECACRAFENAFVTVADWVALITWSAASSIDRLSSATTAPLKANIWTSVVSSPRTSLSLWPNNDMFNFLGKAHLIALHERT